MIRLASLALTFSLLAALPVWAGPACAPIGGGKRDITHAIQAMFDAAAVGDAATFHSATTETFQAYEGGKVFTQEQLLTAVTSAAKRGDHYVWSVTAPQVQVECNLAWAAYTNVGRLDDPSGKHDRKWLESAVLIYDAGHWRVTFLHSSPVAVEGQQP